MLPEPVREDCVRRDRIENAPVMCVDDARALVAQDEHRIRRLALIAERVRAREARIAERELRTRTSRLLQIETEARLELLQIELHLRKLESPERRRANGDRTHGSLLLATLLSVRRFLTHYREQLDLRARRDADHLYALESQVEALARALAQL